MIYKQKVAWFVLLLIWLLPFLGLVANRPERGWIFCLSVFLMGLAIPIYSLVLRRTSIQRSAIDSICGWLVILLQIPFWFWLDDTFAGEILGASILLSWVYCFGIGISTLVSCLGWRGESYKGGRKLFRGATWKLILAILIPASLNLLYFLLSVEALRTYGILLFVVTPFICGLISPIIYNWGRLSSFWESLLVSFISGVLSLFSLLMLGWEGFICIFMALPVVLPFAFIGGAIGHFLSRLGKTRSSTISVILLLLTPLGMGLESVNQQPHEREVSTRVIIEGTVEDVWREVVAFSVIPEPEEWYFRAGIAYPIRAEIRGHGVGSVRYCHFSTGAFVEPITHWEENRRLAFTVSEQPDPMIEVSPYARLHPPHLDSAFLSQRGQFLLKDLGNGKVELTGTTWYLLVMDPVPYWGWISDQLIHRIHGRVLRHIQTMVEGQVDSGQP